MADLMTPDLAWTVECDRLWAELERRARGAGWNSAERRLRFDITGAPLHQLLALDHQHPTRRAELLIRTILELSTALQSSHDAFVDHMNVCASPITLVTPT